jgi:hypothetical protein
MTILSSALRISAVLRRLLLQLAQRVPKVAGNPPGQGLRGRDDVGDAGLDRAAGHAVSPGGGGFLHQRQPTLLLDGAQAEDTVGAHSGEDDGDGLFTLVLRQGTEKKVDRQAQAARGCGLQEVKLAVQQREIVIGRYDINVAGPNDHAVGDLDDRHRGKSLQELGERAVVVRREVLNDDDGHAAVGGHMGEEFLQRLEPARRTADTDDREIGPFDLSAAGVDLGCFTAALRRGFLGAFMGGKGAFSLVGTVHLPRKNGHCPGSTPVPSAPGPAASAQCRVRCRTDQPAGLA